MRARSMPVMGDHRSWRVTAQLGGACSAVAIGFAALAVFVARRPLPPALLTDLDHHVRVYPGGWRYDVATAIRGLGSAPVVVLAAIAVAAALWRMCRRPDLAVVCLVAPLLAGVAELVVRSQIDRSLPRGAELAGAFGYGFPSGHTAGVVALSSAMVIAALERTRDRRVVMCAVLAASALVVAVSSSSVVGGAHRSLDVLGGSLLGVAAALAAHVGVRAARIADR